MYGIGNISRSLASTLQTSGGLGKLPPMQSARGNAFVIDYVPLSEIYTDESNFQNRGDKYSEKSVRSIIDAVANGSFNWFAFDPVILWENPADGKKYVLSGHSRTQAFRQLAKMLPDVLIDGLSFTAIPARIYRGSFEDAKSLALNSNTLATPETLTERAAYYRRIRQRQGITKGKDLKTLKDKALRENNGQMIWDLSYLPDGGISFDSLKAFKLGEESGSTENFLRLATICQWIGKAFQIYKGLSKAHDRELFNFLMTGGYGSKSGQYFNFSSLNDRLSKLYAKNVADDRKVNANGEYTEPFQIAAYNKDDATLDTLNELKKEADGAYQELKNKLKELRDNNATREQIFEVATPYFNGWANALYDWWSLLDRTPKEDNTPSLFGLGRAESQSSKTDIKIMQRKWDRWTYLQTLWGQFIDTISVLVDPRYLISDTFNTIIVYPMQNEEKTFPDIAKALDYAFEKGQLLKHAWIIVNDNDNAVLSNNDVPEVLDGLLCGIFGVEGLGKPTIKFEFEDNAALADFLTKTKEKVDYAETIDADTYSNPVSVNNRRKSRKTTTKKAITTTPTNYLSPSDGTPILPPSDSPKTLPPSKTAKALPQYYEPERPAIVTPPPTSPNTFDTPDWDTIYKRLYDSYQWNSFDPEKSAKSSVESFKQMYGSALEKLPEDRKKDFTTKFVSYVYEIARLNAAAPSAAVTGRGGVTAKQAARYNAAIDRYLQKRALFSDWIDNYINAAYRFAEKQRPKSEKDDERFNSIKRSIDSILTVIRTNAPYDVALLKSNIFNKLRRDAEKGSVKLVERVLDYLKPLGLFTNRHQIWMLSDVAKGAVDRQDMFEKVEESQDNNGKWHVEYDTDEDRVKIIFNDIPDEKTREWLKHNGFRWSPRNKAWQRQITDAARNAVERFRNSGLGKPTIKLEFEDNGELMKLFDTEGINGLTVNDKPAAVFNCPESQLVTQGYRPTYTRLADYSHLIDASDGAKTLKGYGFEKATLDELINACRYYRQVERLAAHLKDPDEVQSAFNIWHWLHTNVRYNYDSPGEEEIRTPARVWADRVSGVDCDCLAVFTACLLLCMGYKPRFEIVAFNNSPTFSHIYVNLDGMAIDRVLPVFLARPGNITKTQIMDIPVYELSGIDGCNTLSGVYANTLAKIQDGTATGHDLNDLRKTQVLLTLKGLDEDEYKLASILMPYVVTIGDDGRYYFDNAKLAAIAQKVDAELALLKQQNSSPEAMTAWLANVIDQLDGVTVDAQTPSPEDTIVVIINPKGCPCRVCGQMVSADLSTLSPQSVEPPAPAETTAAPSEDVATSPLMQTTPFPTVAPSEGETEDGKGVWPWVLAIAGAFGVGAIAASNGKKKKKSKRH